MSHLFRNWTTMVVKTCFAIILWYKNIKGNCKVLWKSCFVILGKSWKCQLFLQHTPPVVQLLYFSKSNSPSKWILRIPVHQVLHQSFSLVSALSVTCLSAAQNSVRNASPGNVIKNSWCERTGWLKVAQSDNYAWRNTFKPLSLFQMLVCWAIHCKVVKFNTLSFMGSWFWLGHTQFLPKCIFQVSHSILDHLTMLNSLFIFNTSVCVAKLTFFFFFLDKWLWIQNS